MHRRQFGFTLLELMIVVLIIAVLAALAITSYGKQVRKGKRAEAKQALSEVSLRQEKWRSNHVAYLGADSVAADKTAFGALPTPTNYTIAITSNESGTAWTATATPKADQAKDSCGTMSLGVSSGTVSKTPTTQGCW